MMKRFLFLVLTFPLLLSSVGVCAQTEAAATTADTGVPEAVPEVPAPARSLESIRLQAEPVPVYLRCISALGLLSMIVVAWVFSSRRDRIPWRVVGWGLVLQLTFGVFVLKTPIGLRLFRLLNQVVSRLLRFTDDGARFLFGAYLDREFTVALNVLPTIVFFSALMSVLYHLGIMERLVKAVAWVMQRTLKTSGAESLSAAANIFVGQTEAPLVVRPFISKMTQSELMAVMSGGFATVAGGVLAAYVGMLQSSFPDIAGHLIAASVMSAPASLLIAKVMVPETEVPETAGTLSINSEKPYVNLIDAAAGGAADGLKLALNVGAMLLAFIALVAMVNYALSLPALWHNEAIWMAVRGEVAASSIPAVCVSPDGASAIARCVESLHAGGILETMPEIWHPMTIERVLGWVFSPFAFLMGVPWGDCSAVGALLGEKIVLTEFLAYRDLSLQIDQLSHRAVVISTYALCGFANFGSIAIQIGGIGGIAPDRRSDLARLGIRAMIAGTLAAFMTACVAGLLV